MRAAILPIPIFILLLPLAASTGAQAPPTVYGSGLSDALELTPAAEILADPDGFAGKEVQVRGQVTGVCPMMGCWMELEDEGSRLRIKVEDGVIVFPPEAEGHWAVARGTVELLDMTREQYLDWQRHLAEELGAELDESTIGEPPYRLVQIAGTGASIDG